MRREFSAGGVAIRRLRGEWVFAAIRPGGKKPGVWALPKGLIGEGEKPDATGSRDRGGDGDPGAARDEARRHPLRLHVGGRAGLQGGQLLPAAATREGRLGEIEPEMRIEVDEARWLPARQTLRSCSPTAASARWRRKPSLSSVTTA